MKKIIIAIFPAIFLVGCAQEKTTNIPSEFAPYVKRFQAVARQMGSSVDVNNLSVRYDSSLNGSNTIGVCRTGGGLVPEITINTQYWKSAWVSNSDREQLMFHEMGHCVLDRGHDETEVRSADYSGSYRIPASIMNPYHLGRTYYEGNYGSYMGELFLGQAPAAMYANAASAWPATAYYASEGSATASKAAVTYAAKVESETTQGLTDADYGNIADFGCAEENHEGHDHE